jgi:hypothetical protein
VLEKCKSSFLFSIAEDLGIPLEMGVEEVFEDAALFTFVTKYHELSRERDKELAKHLQEASNIFRTYLPYTPRVFGLVHQILWYFDEVIVRDPIEVQISNLEPKNLENTKNNLRRTLQVLNMFRVAIDSGYLLLFGSTYLPGMPQDVPPEVQKILQSKELIDALNEAVSYGMDRRFDSRGQEWIIYQVELETGGMLGWHIKGIQGSVKSPPISFGEELPRVSKDELSECIDPSVLSQIKNLYPREVQRALRSVAIASMMNSTVIFNRNVDVAILNAAGGHQINEWQQASAIGSFNLSLPYIEGIPPGRLFELRLDDPQSFHDFRSIMAEIVTQSLDEDPLSAPQVARLAVERKIIPHIRAIEAEMESIRSRAKMFGLGLPLATATGLLGGAVVGLGVQTLLPIAMGSGYVIVREMAEIPSSLSKIKSNPFWFIWKAKHV